MVMAVSTITKEIHNLYRRYNSTTPATLKANLRKIMKEYNLEPEDVYSALKLNRNTFYSTLNPSNVQKPSLELLVRISLEFEIDLTEFM